MKTIAFLGGTFDPVHVGHLRLAIEAQEALEFDELYLLPAYLPNLRDTPNASAPHRLAMLQLAVANGPLRVDSRELEQAGKTFTIDTLQALRRERPDDSLSFVLGQDAFNGLTRWHRWSELLDYAHLVVATRPGFTAPTDPTLIELLAKAQSTSAGTLRERRAGHILLMEIPRLLIAATDLRARNRTGRSIMHLTPPAVVDYIARHQLYQH